MLNPITPHIAHALHQALGHDETLIEDLPWPVHDPAALERDSITMAVQVNGKLRGQIAVAVDAPRAQIEQQAMSEESVIRYLEGFTVRKVIVVPGKIVNIVVG